MFCSSKGLACFRFMMLPKGEEHSRSGIVSERKAQAELDPLVA